MIPDPRALLLLLGALVLGGCSDSAEPGSSPGSAAPAGLPAPRSGPVLLVAMDGLEWDLVLPLVRQGRLPHLQRLMARGRFGLLETFEPTLSPAIWTSVATGKTPLHHGIVQFARPAPGPAGFVLYNRLDRSTKALWNIFSDAGLETDCFGWWMTYPVERIHGVMVAQTHRLEQVDIQDARQVWKGTLHENVANQVYPESDTKDVLDTLSQVESELDPLLESVFGTFPHPLGELGERLWNNARWSFRADTTYAEIAQRTLRERGVPDLGLVYFGSTDVAGHFFYRYLAPQWYEHPPSAEEIENFAAVIEHTYVYVDGLLGQLVDAAGAGTTVMVVSDHGMHAVNRAGTYDVEDPTANFSSGNHQDAPPGVFVAAGPWIRPSKQDPRSVAREDLERIGTVLDLAPTLLAMERIPRGEDMEGEVLGGLFTEAARIGEQPPAIPTHDDEAFFQSQREPFAGEVDQTARLRQLKELGYLPAESESAKEDTGSGDREADRGKGGGG